MLLTEIEELRRQVATLQAQNAVLRRRPEDGEDVARVRAEEALRESRRRLEEAQSIARVGSWSSGVGASRDLEWSAECYRIFGVPIGAVVTVDTFLAGVHPADRERVAAASRAAIEHGAAYDIEHRVLRSDGTSLWVHERAVVERDVEGRPRRMVGTVQDIDERYLAVAALEASEQRYRRIVENTSEGVWVYDPAGCTTFVNARMAEMLGRTVEECLGLPITAFTDASEIDLVRARIERRKQGISEQGNVVVRRKDASTLRVSVRATPLFDAQGVFEAAIALVTDVSELRQADELRARLAAIVESSEDAIVGATLEAVITSWNRGAEALYLYPAEDVIGKPLLFLIPPTAPGSVSPREDGQLLARVALGQVQRYEATRLRKDGSRVDVAVTVSPVRDASGTVIGVSKIARDLTSKRQAEATQRRTEDQFRQAQKMEAVGRLAGGVAHDFNNLLSVILSYATLALEDLKEGDPLRADLMEIEAAGKRASQLTRQLLAFSRQQVLQPRVLDLNQVILGMLSMMRRLLGEDVVLTTSTDPSIGRVLADPGQVEQVLMNLAVNARDAMKDGGKLTIETSNVELEADRPGTPVGIPVGAYVMVAVSDTGIGMDASTTARIFEPFFTTKETGKGTGLGLSTVFGIVRQSGGWVGVYSEPGAGSTFKVYLPRTDQPADDSGRPPVPLVARGTETILLVEDEEQVRAVACAILRRNGYHVLEASNGGEAFLIAREFPARIHLLLTDVVMPRMSGRVLAEELAPLRPAMRVLFSSGYTDDAIIHHGVMDAGVAFLQKPFTPGALLRKVRESLDAPPGGNAGLAK